MHKLNCTHPPQSTHMYVHDTHPYTPLYAKLHMHTYTSTYVTTYADTPTHTYKPQDTQTHMYITLQTALHPHILTYIYMHVYTTYNHLCKHSHVCLPIHTSILIPAPYTHTQTHFPLQKTFRIGTRGTPGVA